MKFYEISEVARLFNLSPSGMRYYEEMGLLLPERSEAGRRRYSENDLLGLIYLNRMHALDITLRETKDYFHYNMVRTPEETGDLLLERMEQVQQKALYYAELARHLKNIGSMMKRLPELLSEFETERTGEFYFLTQNPFFGKGEKQQAEIARWISVEPMVQVCCVFRAQGDRIVMENRGFAVEKNYADRTRLPLREEASVLPASESLHTVLRVDNSTYYGVRENEVKPIVQLIQKTKDWKCIRIVTKLLYLHLEGQTRVKYFEVWANELHDNFAEL